MDLYVCLKNENLKCEGAPLLIGLNNSQVKTLKAVIDHNIHLDQKMKRDLRLEKALHCLNYITFGTWRDIMSWLDITYFLQWHALHCCASQHCSKMFLLALIEVPIEFISAKWLIWNCRKPWPSDEATIKLSSSLQSLRRPFMPLSSSVFHISRRMILESLLPLPHN